MSFIRYQGHRGVQGTLHSYLCNRGGDLAKVKLLWPKKKQLKYLSYCWEQRKSLQEIAKYLADRSDQGKTGRYHG